MKNNNKHELRKPLVLTMAILVAGLVASTLVTVPAFAMNCLNCRPRDGGPGPGDSTIHVHGCGLGVFTLFGSLDRGNGCR
jgi:hypothetical protein